MMDIRGLPFILASASPRRREILEAHGHSPIVMPADINENIDGAEKLSPEELTIRLAELKAETVLDRLESSDWIRGCIILGVDTIVYKDQIIGKPANEKDAVSILRSLRNAEHEVISGVCLIHASPDTSRGILSISEKISFYDKTKVGFGIYSDDDIISYIRANPPYDKSGSYAIQSEWGQHVTGISGDIENVIGLPYIKLSSHLL
jgi:septum formation protein